MADRCAGCIIVRQRAVCRIEDKQMTEGFVEFAGCYCTATTEKAILVAGIQEEPIWIPLSQVSDDSEVYSIGDEGTLIVTEWIAIQKGFV